MGERKEVKVSYCPKEVLSFLLQKDKGSFTSLDLQNRPECHSDLSIAEWILYDLQYLNVLKRAHEMVYVKGGLYRQYFLLNRNIPINLPQKREATFIRYILKKEEK